ncbi:sulfotransferase [Alteromonas sp. C1M14]|uniref:sulfotransferase family protein n=1 Tax=Alteromonas sp. C1M14 TaxID=2841567 RepID=UPI001C0A0700|nr:sulfotransferase [Alteromonas sp. C1M14]
MKTKALIIIGMHRSGTSAVSGALAERGVFMGDDLYGPQKGVNDKGFFENSALVRFNERLFDELNWSWDDPLASAHKKCEWEKLDKWLPSAVSLIKQEYGKHAIWGMKDPRTSLLLPFWQKVLAEVDVEPTYIVMMRHPAEVAGSLAKRDQFSTDKSLMLWLNYTLSSLVNTAADNRIVVSFDDLMSSPQGQINTIVTHIGLHVESDSKSDFIDTRLRKQNNRQVSQTPLGTLSESVFNQALKNADLPGTLVEQYNQYCDALSAVLKEHISDIKKSEVFYRHLFFDAYRTFWWKAILPVKKVEEFVRKLFKNKPGI